VTPLQVRLVLSGVWGGAVEAMEKKNSKSKSAEQGRGCSALEGQLRSWLKTISSCSLIITSSIMSASRDLARERERGAKHILRQIIISCRSEFKL